MKGEESMKKRSFLLIGLVLILLLSSCSMEPTIPENTKTIQEFSQNIHLYQNSVHVLKEIGYNSLISRNDFYAQKGSENFEGFYLQNMETSEFLSFSDPNVEVLFETCSIKLIDTLFLEDSIICAFDMCTPGKNFDFGIYFSSEDRPIYFGNPSLELTPSGNGFSYEKKASFGVQFTYYTEKICDQYYYYEIA